MLCSGPLKNSKRRYVWSWYLRIGTEVYLTTTLKILTYLLFFPERLDPAFSSVLHLQGYIKLYGSWGCHWTGCYYRGCRYLEVTFNLDLIEDWLISSAESKNLDTVSSLYILYQTPPWPGHWLSLCLDWRYRLWLSQRRKFDQTTDLVCSLGMLLWEMFTHQAPFEGLPEEEIEACLMVSLITDLTICHIKIPATFPCVLLDQLAKLTSSTQWTQLSKTSRQSLQTHCFGFGTWLIVFVLICVSILCVAVGQGEASHPVGDGGRMGWINQCLLPPSSRWARLSRPALVQAGCAHTPADILSPPRTLHWFLMPWALTWILLNLNSKWSAELEIDMFSISYQRHFWLMDKELAWLHCTCHIIGISSHCLLRLIKLCSWSDAFHHYLFAWNFGFFLEI